MDAKELLLIILYIGLIILVVVSIVLIVRLMRTLKRVDKVVDDAMVKVDKLNGLFDIIDATTEAISSFGDYFITGIASKIGKIFKKKGKDKDE